MAQKPHRSRDEPASSEGPNGKESKPAVSLRRVSPLLSNAFLDEVDKELEKRGVAFVRYADDLDAYVGSQRAGEDLMKTLKRLYAGLRLRINETKSAVAEPWNLKFLGYSFWSAPRGKVKRRVAPKAP
jgi:retron-type reverse transcriptase